MIGYVTLGTNDLARAAKFYDALLARARRQTHRWNRSSSSRGRPGGGPGIGLIKPFDGKRRRPATARWSRSRSTRRRRSRRVFDKAMKLGAKDEGGPGLRWGTFYAAYFRDLDGNKLNVFHFPH